MATLATDNNPYASTTSVPTTTANDDNNNNMSEVNMENNNTNSAPVVQARKVPAKTEQGKILSITVSDPVKQGDGLKAFISYKINTKTDLPEFDMSQFSVIRRYSDFVWLISQLTRDFKGYIIPPLPEKSVVGRFTPSFIETRRRALEHCLNRIANHSVLRKSDHFKAFLEAKDDGLLIQKTAAKQEANSKSKGFFGWLTDTATSTLNNVRGSVKLERTQDDVKFDEIAQYIATLEPQLQSVHRQTTGVIKRELDLGTSLFDFGLSFTLMGQADNGVTLRAALTKMGHTADSLSVLAKETADKECESFEEQLKDYIRVVMSVKVAIGQRNEALNAYLLAKSNHESRVDAHQRLVGVPGKEDKAQQAMDAVVEAQSTEEKKKREFHEVQQTLFKEFDRFKQEKAEDFKTMMIAYSKLRIEHCKAEEAEWKKILPVLDNIKNDETNVYGNSSGKPDADEDVTGDSI